MGLIRLAGLAVALSPRPRRAVEPALPQDDPPRGSTADYLLVDHSFVEPGVRQHAWTLDAWQDQHRQWSLPLAGRGAGLHAGPRVAKAVAVRVLAELQVAVTGWVDEDHADLPTYRARVLHATAVQRATAICCHGLVDVSPNSTRPMDDDGPAPAAGGMRQAAGPLASPCGVEPAPPESQDHERPR